MVALPLLFLRTSIRLCSFRTNSSFIPLPLPLPLLLFDPTTALLLLYLLLLLLFVVVVIDDIDDDDFGLLSSSCLMSNFASINSSRTSTDRRFSLFTACKREIERRKQSDKIYISHTQTLFTSLVVQMIGDVGSTV